MSEESTQRHTGGFATPAAHHRASLESATSQKKKPVKPPRQWEDRIIRFLAGLFCLGAAGFCLWYWHDLVSAVVLVGIAIGAINPREVVGAMLSKRSGHDDKLDVEGDG